MIEPIADELRFKAYALAVQTNMRKADYDELCAIADRIDARDAKLRKYVAWLESNMTESYFITKDAEMLIRDKRRDFGIEVV